jgi:hypothetical protein
MRSPYSSPRGINILTDRCDLSLLRSLGRAYPDEDEELVQKPFQDNQEPETPQQYALDPRDR